MNNLSEITTMRWDIEWEKSGKFVWMLYHSGKMVGEVYERKDGSFKWHCKTSDWRDTDAKSIEQAKAECEANYWRNMVGEIQTELNKLVWI